MRYGIGVLAVVLGGGLVAACGGDHPAATAVVEQPPLAVETGAVEDGEVADGIEVGGTVQARAVAAVAARVMGQVREVRVKPGDRVAAGQVLAVLDAADVAASARSAVSAAGAAGQGVSAAEAESRAADAALTLARASYGRVQSLEARRSATRQELDEATAALAAAEARVAGARARVAQASEAAASAVAASEASRAVESYTRITAPFAGVVTEKLVEAGAMVMPGTPIVRLEDTSAFRLDVRLDESRVANVTPGTRVEVVVDALAAGAPLMGTVDEVARAVDVDARTFLVKVSLPSTAGLRSGLFGRLTAAGPRRRALTVPTSALVRRGQVTSVFVVEGGVARVRLVDVQSVDGNRAEVRAGLAAGDAVVVAPPPSLTDGRRVTAGGR
jgi:HlyD family secretion protein